MRLNLGILICAFVAGIAVSGNLLAQQLPRASNKVLILDNERAVEGEIELRGEFYIVRRAVGEMTIPANKVLAVCASMEEAFQLLSSQTNLRDDNERLRLARWCEVHGLREQAIAEAKAAMQLRPGNEVASKLLVMLQRPTIASPTPPISEISPKATPASEPEIIGECLALFTTKVQTILMNSCVSCHSNTHGSSGFVLTRPTEASSRNALQSNLTSVIKQICFEQPGASPLLHKACTSHGGADEAVMPNRQMPPYTTLQSWVELVVVRHPTLKTYGTKAIVESRPALTAKQPRDGFGTNVATLPKALVENPEKGNAQAPALLGSLPVPGNIPGIRDPITSANAVAPAARVIPTEPSLGGISVAPRSLLPTSAGIVQPNSEFDPMIFNRMWHGQR